MDKIHYFHQRLSIVYKRNTKSALTIERAAVTIAYKMEPTASKAEYKITWACAFTAPGDQFCKATGRLKARARLGSETYTKTVNHWLQHGDTLNFNEYRSLERMILASITLKDWPKRWIEIQELPSVLPPVSELEISF